MRANWLILVLLGTLAGLPSAAAQFPGLAPVIETRAEWTEFQPEPDERTVRLDAGDGLLVPARAGFRILAPGGYLLCQPNTVYRFVVALDGAPTWLTTSLEPDEKKAVSVSIPQGTHQNGWPEKGSWHWQATAGAALRWNLDQVPDNATAEIRLVGKGAVTAVSGGCQPDPLAQAVRHIPETLNVTKPYVPPLVTAPSTEGCALGASNACQTVVPLEPKESPNLSPLLLFMGIAFSLLRRRG